MEAPKTQELKNLQTYRSSIQDKKILIIDDQPDVIAGLSKILSTLGAKIETAENGKDGIKLIKTNTYDLLIIDLMMPEVSGWDVIDATKDTLIEQSTALLLITGAVDSETVQSLNRILSFKSDMKRQVTLKGTPAPELLESIQNLLSQNS